MFGNGLAQCRRQGGRGMRSLAGCTQRQYVTGIQLLAVEAADGAQAVERAAAQHFGHVNAAVDGNVGTGAQGHHAEADGAAGSHFKGGVGGLFFAVNDGHHFGAGYRNHGIAVKAQYRSHQSAFQYGGGFVVADQEIGGAEGILIHRAGRRNAQMVITLAALVLNGGGQAGFENG